MKKKSTTISSYAESPPEFVSHIASLSARWYGRLKLMEGNLSSASSYNRETSARRLTQERLEKELFRERKEKEDLTQKLNALLQKCGSLSEEFNKLKREMENDLAHLNEKCHGLEEEKKMREQELIKAAAETESLKSFQTQLQSDHVKNMEKIEVEKKQLVQNYYEIKQDHEILLRALAEKKDQMDRLLAENDLLKNSVAATAAKPASEPEHLSPISETQKGLISRWIDWWSEPVTTVSLPRIFH